MHLPQAFTEHTAALFGPQRWERFVRAFEEPAPVSNTSSLMNTP